MQEYVILLVGNEDWAPEEYSEQEFQDEMELHVRFQEAVQAAGAKITASAALTPTKDAVRITGGMDSPVFTDGPFPEMKEIVNGFYVLEADGIDAAKRLAAMIPVGGGHTLVFPTYDLSEYGG